MMTGLKSLLGAAVLVVLVAATAGCGATVTTTATATQMNTSTVTSTMTSVTTANFTSTTTAVTTQTATVTATLTPTVAKPANPILILATTTSTRDTGLLDVLIPLFQSQTGYTVQTVAVGSGAAIALGQSGNADVLLVHSPSAELTLTGTGAGINRVLVMHNDFVIVGPASDPAGIKGMTSASAAMKKIADSKSTFVSRGDASGTNAFELSVWAGLGIAPAGQSWYLSTGQGMGSTLIVADQKNGYTVADRGTYVAFQKSISLVLDVNGTQVDPSMINVYHVIQVNAALYPKVNAAGAKAFSDFMVAPATQQIISTFGLITYGSALFTPDAGKTDADLGTK
jgi:tungstate transport system substrate-binding protein